MAKFIEYKSQRWVTFLCVLWLALVIPLLVLIPFIKEVSTRRVVAIVAFGISVLVFLVACEILLLYLAVYSGRLVRLGIESDEVQVIYPVLGRWRNRAFRFGEIASVEVRYAGWGTLKEVRIGLQDGSSVPYMTRDEAKGDELLEVLKRGVAEPKPAKQDWSELA